MLSAFCISGPVFAGLRRFGSRDASFSSAAVACGIRKQPWRLGSHPGDNPFERSDSLVKNRHSLTAWLLSHPREGVAEKLREGEPLLCFDLLFCWLISSHRGWRWRRFDPGSTKSIHGAELARPTTKARATLN